MDLTVMRLIVSNENQTALTKYQNDLQTYLNITCQNWIAENTQKRNLCNNVNFTPSPVPLPPAKTVYTLNETTGEVTITPVVDSTIPLPKLPDWVAPTYTPGFGGGQSPNLNSQENDLNTLTISQINSKIDKILAHLGIS